MGKRGREEEGKGKGEEEEVAARKGGGDLAKASGSKAGVPKLLPRKQDCFCWLE